MTSLLDARRRRAARPRRRPRQGHRAGRVRLRAPGATASPTPCSCCRRSPRARSRAVDAARGAGHPAACSPCSRTRTRRGWPRGDDARAARAAGAAGRLPRADRRRGGGREPGDRPRGGGARARRVRRAARTTWRCATTIPASTGRRRSTRRSPTDTEQGDPDGALAGAAVTHRRDLRHARLPQQPDGAARHAGGAGTAARLTLYDSTQGAPSARAIAGAGVRPRARARARDLPARRRRLRLQGHAAPARRRRRAGGQGGRPAGQARRHPPADVRARPATARRRSSACASAPTPTAAHRDRPRRVRAELDDQGVRRADRRGHADDVRRAEPPHDAPARPARRADAVVDARARRVPGHVRARVGDRRAGDRARASTRSSCACATSRRSIPRSGIPFSARATSSPACARAPSASAGRRATRAPGARRDGAWLIGTGVAASTYPAYRSPAQRRRRTRGDGRYTVRIAAADIGTGARTVLTQIAADALGAAAGARARGDRRLRLPPAGRGRRLDGHRLLGHRPCTRRCRALRESGGDEAQRRHRRRRRGAGATSPGTRSARSSPRCASNTETGEIRVPRLLGVFAAGRIINAKTARSQLIGGMTMGLGMALLEESVMDARVRRLRQPRPRAVPRAGLRRRARHRRRLDRGGRPAPQPDGLQGHRRDRHRRHGGGDRQRRPPRHRHRASATCRSASTACWGRASRACARGPGRSR